MALRLVGGLKLWLVAKILRKSKKKKFKFWRKLCEIFRFTVGPPDDVGMVGG